jgi:DNA polymerase-1
MSEFKEDENLLMIDAHAMMYRAFYAVRFAPKLGEQDVGMVYGCVTIILQLIEQFTPDYVVVAFDSREKTFRHKMDENYKAHRKKAPDHFYSQIPLVEELIKTLEFPILKVSGFEADDLIGTLAKKAENKNITSYIASGDLDFLQLMSNKIFLVKFNGKEPLIFDRTKTFEKLGVYPEQIIDFKAISGDSSDNYKGIPGVGVKTTVQLLTEYKNIDNILKNLENLKPKLREKFEENKDYLLHCQKLATIHLSSPVDYNFENKFKFNIKDLLLFLDKMNFFALKKRAINLSKILNQDLELDFNENPNITLNNNQIPLF